MQTGDSFTVTLPSNSNMAAYPKNRGCDYTVTLNPTVNLASSTLNEDMDWEVALASMQYTNSFYEMNESATLRVYVQFPNPKALATEGAVQSPGVVTFDDLYNAEYVALMSKLDAIDKRILIKQFLKNAAANEKWVLARLHIFIPAGRYTTHTDLYDHIVEQFNAAFDVPLYKTLMRATVDGTTGIHTFSLVPNTNKLYLYTDKLSLVKALGMHGTAFEDELLTRLSSAGPPKIYQIRLNGKGTPQFDTVQSLYVYTDIVKDQHVGDTQAPLLEIVPVQGAPGQRVHYTFNVLTYISVKQPYLETISIYVRDEAGNPVPFPDDVENVVCRLRFRRKKGGGGW